MISISPAGRNTLAAENTLKLFRDLQQTQPLAAKVTPTIEGGSKARFATIARLIDALMDIKSVGMGEPSAPATSSGGPTAEQRAAAHTAFEAAKVNEDTARRATIPADKKAWFDGLAGGGAWVLQDQPKVDAATVAADIQSKREEYASDTGRADIAFYRGLKQAAADGSLKIVPASEVAEFGYATFGATFYNADGFVQGSAYTGTANLQYAKDQREKGVHVSAFSLNGRDYVTMWPVSAEEKEKGSWAA
jgi:hypothetical protein